MMPDSPSPDRYDIITVGSATEDVMVNTDAAASSRSRTWRVIVPGWPSNMGGKIHVDDILISVGAAR